MNIYYDYQILYNQKYGGISRYYFDLIRTINQNCLANTAIHCKFNTNHYFAGYKEIGQAEAFLDIKSSAIRRPLRLYGHLVNQEITRQCAQKADIVHLTYYNPYALKLKGVKKVVTVYDMIEEVKRQDSHLDTVIEYKKKCIQEADHIIAISKSTKNDILRLYPSVDEKNISVIYIGTSIKKSRRIVTDLPDKYILFVGKRDGYKNFNGFFRAIKPLLLQFRDLKLLCVGGGCFTTEEDRIFGETKRQVFQMDVDDETLAAAYTKALCFVFPSLYEGFGIPTLEAFTCGCPAVISNTSSMPEVGGDAVLYFDPENEVEMRMQIEKVIHDNTLRLELKDKGKERGKRFSWEAIARQTVECYKKVLKDG